MALSDRVGQPDLAFVAFALASMLAGIASLRLPEPGRNSSARPNLPPALAPAPVRDAAT
jgi:hypothetical protein